MKWLSIDSRGNPDWQTKQLKIKAMECKALTPYAWLRRLNAGQKRAKPAGGGRICRAFHQDRQPDALPHPSTSSPHRGKMSLFNALNAKKRMLDLMARFMLNDFSSGFSEPADTMVRRDKKGSRS
ncbi:MAG: hypothetical protein PVF97_00800 [Desulfobacterales bacterium]|jgi:hypothetical protein